MATQSNHSDAQARLNQVVTRSELAANKSIGWYVNTGGVVYQVVTISPREVRYIGRLEKGTDLQLKDPDTTTPVTSKAPTPRPIQAKED